MSLPKPKGRQIEVLYLPLQGHVVILGTAGSGKTTMAILRAHFLAQICRDQQERVLLVTYNKALVTYLQALAEAQQIPFNLEIRNYHHFARGYLNSKGKLGNDVILGDPLVFMTRALVQIKEEKGTHEILERPPAFFVEEGKWISGCGIDTVDAYVRLRQDTNRRDLTDQESELVFAVYQRYKTLRDNTRYMYDWDDIAQAVEQEFATDATQRYYKHVVIDEGQDFTPAMLRSLARAIPQDGSLTFFGDMAQQIYGNRMSWHTAGLNPRKSWEFKENYRNTSQIVNLAIAMTKMPTFQGVVDLIHPNKPGADGPLPTIVQCNSPEQERDLVIRQAEKSAQHQSVAILVRKREQEQVYLTAFGKSAQRLHRNLPAWMSTGISVGTYHAAKGFEFDTVILPHCNADMLPDQERLAALPDTKEGLAQESRLLYVGITRARTRLIITYTGQVTELLPTDQSLYKWLQR